MRDMMRTTHPLAGVVVAGLLAAGQGVKLVTEPEVPDVSCPSSCENLFGKLEEGVQEVKVQLRGGAKLVGLKTNISICYGFVSFSRRSGGS